MHATHRRTAAFAMALAVILAATALGAVPSDARSASTRETSLIADHEPTRPAPSQVLVATGVQFVFEALEPGSDDFVGTPACASPILSGHVVNIWRQGSEVYGILATEHPAPAMVEIRLWDGVGFDETFVDDVLRTPTQTAVYFLTPGTTYYAEAVATDAQWNECPPRYGSFTVPADI